MDQDTIAIQTLTPKLVCSCSTTGVQHASPTEVLLQCANSLLLLDVQSGRQRVLVGSGQGIKACTCSVKAGIIALAEQGYQPRIAIYDACSLQLLQSIHASAAFGYSAVALSADGELLAVCGREPELLLTVWHWRKGVALAGAELAAAVSSISFHPADASCLVTVAAPADAEGDRSAGAAAQVQVWQLHTLWDRHELQPSPLCLPAGCQACCHAWAPEGVYVGCTNGAVVCMNPESGDAIGTFQTSAAMVPAAAAAGTAEGAGAAGPAAVATTASISSIAINKHWLVVGSAASAHLTFLQRCCAAAGTAAVTTSHGALQQPAALVLLGHLQVSSIGCQGLCFAGPLSRDLLATTLDGSLLRLSHPSTSPPLLAELQVEPLADWHVGCAAGVAPAADGVHMVSCGADGSIRVWAAAAGGQLVSKRDVGGALTCCVASVTGHPLLAVGSKAGVLRLVGLSDLRNLPVVFCERLFKAPLSCLALSANGEHLAVAAHQQQQVAVLRVDDAGQGAEVLGYVHTADQVLSMAWVSDSSGAPILVASLASSRLLAVAVGPHLQQQTDLGRASQSSGSRGAGSSQWACVATDVAMRALAVLSHDVQAAGANGRGSGPAGSVDVVGLGSDGHLHWLQLPSSTPGWASLSAANRTLQRVSRLVLTVPGVAMALSPSQQQLLVAAQDGCLLLLPAVAAAAEQAVASEQGVAMTLPVLAYDNGDAAPALAWSAGGHWVASAAADGSVMLHRIQTSADAVPAAAPLPAAGPAVVQDVEIADNENAPTWPEAAAAATAAAASPAAAGARQAMLQKLQALESRLKQVLEANAAAPPEQQLCEAELVLNMQLLTGAQAQAAAEEAALLAEATRSCQVQQVQAKRLRTMCWDAFQVKRAVCTGLRSSEPQVTNFQMAHQDDTAWAEVAERRREQVLTVHQHVLDQDCFSRSAASSTATGVPAAGAADAVLAAAAAVAAAAGASAEASIDGAIGLPGSISLAAEYSSASSQRSSTAGTEPSQHSSGNWGLPSPEVLAQLGRLRQCSNARQCLASDLLLPELKVTTSEAKLMQAECYKRRMWELRSEFNKEFDALVKQKHTDANRLVDLGTRMDELVRELVKIHLMLNPAAAAAEPAGQAGPQGEPASGANARTADSATEGVVSGSQLSSELAVGRLVPHWSPQEDMQDVLLTIKPQDVKASKYLTSAERAKAAAEDAAAESARRAAAADSSRDRALQQMMGGRLERSVDEVAELVTSRPGWMVTSDPSTFTEEQLRQYKEYQAKEAAAIEERLKRKGIMETELRTLKIAAEDIATKFDAAVAALATKRLDVLAEVTALEGRVLRLLADEEVASVTAGLELQQQAAAQLQAARDSLAGIEQELAATQQLQGQQQEVLSAVHAEERATDSSFKRQFAQLDVTITPRLTALYKARLIPAAQAASGSASGPSKQQPEPTASAELTFPQPHLGGNMHGSGSGSAAAAAAGAGASHSSEPELVTPLGVVEMLVVPLQDSQCPEGLDEALWLRFEELRSARAQLELESRQQAAKALCLKQQLQLLLHRRSEASSRLQAAEEALLALQTRQADAMQDVEVQLSLKQGQVECWPAGLAAMAQKALLLARQEINGLNSIILGKGEAKLDLLRKMKDFKRGIYQLEWENKKADMEAEDATRLTQQLQLLHVTKEFQQQVKAASSGVACSTAGGASAGARSSKGAVAAGRPASSAGGGSSAAGTNAPNREVASLENLLKVRESLHANAVEKEKRQLRAVEAQLAGKAHDNATLALHLTGLDRMLDEAARLREAAVSSDASLSADRVARSLMMQSKLRDIAEAQAGEIADAKAELRAWHQRCFPCLPGDPQAGDQAGGLGPDQAASAGSRGGRGRSCTLPDLNSRAAVARTPPGGGQVGKGLTPAGGFAANGVRNATAATAHNTFRLPALGVGGAAAKRRP